MNPEEFPLIQLCEILINQLPKNDPYVWHYRQLLTAWRRGDLESGSQLKEMLISRIYAQA